MYTFTDSSTQHCVCVYIYIYIYIYIYGGEREILQNLEILIDITNESR